MQTKNLIAINEFCINYNIEISFINNLHHTGLIEIETVDNTKYINADQIQLLEKIIRLYELDINLEGIETITYLLERISQLQNEIISLKNRLQFYETF